MKKILFVNPSLRLYSSTKFLPVGIASVMSYLKSCEIDFDFLDIDINDMEDNHVEDFLEDNRYDIILSGSIVTHYKWMKWFTKRARDFNRDATDKDCGSSPKIITLFFFDNEIFFLLFVSFK